MHGLPFHNYVLFFSTSNSIQLYGQSLNFNVVLLLTILLLRTSKVVLEIYFFFKIRLYCTTFMLKQQLTKIKVRNPKGPPLQARCPGETTPILEFNTIIAGPTYRGAKWA